jgi:hypothetical protein
MQLWLDGQALAKAPVVASEPAAPKANPNAERRRRKKR